MALGREPWRDLNPAAQYLRETDRRDLEWLVQWQVLGLTWHEIGSQSGVAPEHMSRIRQAVTRMAPRLDLTLRKEKPGPKEKRGPPPGTK